VCTRSKKNQQFDSFAGGQKLGCANQVQQKISISGVLGGTLPAKVFQGNSSDLGRWQQCARSLSTPVRKKQNKGTALAAFLKPFVPQQ